jgi:uncharacterized membrane protein
MVSYKRHLLKTISWRAIGTLDTIILSGIITGSWTTGLTIGGVEVITKMVLYFLHERVWYRFINFGVKKSMLIEVSNGELLDKISILQIKLHRITNENQLSNIKKEYNSLIVFKDILIKKHGKSLELQYQKLFRVNNQLWDTENKIRESENLSIFDQDFINLARLVYVTNDKRSKIKKKINIMTNSDIIEEKSYYDA